MVPLAVPLGAAPAAQDWSPNQGQIQVAIHAAVHGLMAGQLELELDGERGGGPGAACVQEGLPDTGGGRADP